MDWWVWVIVVVLVLAAVLVFYEWRSRNRALGRGIAGLQGGRHEHVDLYGNQDPFGTRRSLEKPHD
jgi:hypothetical protein